jgi:hypothetical protein
MQLLLKSAVANLLQDVRVASFVDFEGFAAVGADDFVHWEWLFVDKIGAQPS